MGLFRGLKTDPRALPLLLAAASLLLNGCVPEDAVSKSSAKPPQATAPALKPSQPTVSAAASSPALAAPPATPQVQALIDSVESAYQSGVANYHAGQLKAAKTDFDRAVDLMLSSNLDLRAQPQLHDEFDRVVDAVNTLEMEALKQGNGFAPKIEPAPVDIANDVTFPVDPTVKAQAIQELKTTQSDLPLLINDPVAGFISYFSSKGRGTLMRSLERGPLSHHDHGSAGRREGSTGSYLPGSGRVRLPTADRKRAFRCRGNVAVHALRRLWSHPQWMV